MSARRTREILLTPGARISISADLSAYGSIVDARVERMRPATVAATSDIAGMVPRLQDPLFDSMATASMFGQVFTTVLTLSSFRSSARSCSACERIRRGQKNSLPL